MYSFFRSGPYLFALSLIGIGLVHIITGHFPGFMPFPAGMPGKQILAWFFGILISAGGLFILMNRQTVLTSVITGFAFLLLLVYPQAVHLLSGINNPNSWVTFLETLCFACFAFMLVYVKIGDPKNKMALISKYLFACCLLIFGIQHFMYEQFIYTLLPAWLPAKMFWLWMVKAAFILSAISIATNILLPLAMLLLGLMFLTWVLILHGPRVAVNPQTEAEWSSLLIALAMAGGAFITAALYRRVSVVTEKTVSNP